MRGGESFNHVKRKICPYGPTSVEAARARTFLRFTFHVLRNMQHDLTLSTLQRFNASTSALPSGGRTTSRAPAGISTRLVRPFGQRHQTAVTGAAPAMTCVGASCDQ